jgi:hypothetical protein
MSKHKILNDFTIYWRDGRRELIKGVNLDVALANSGYTTKSLGIFDFCVDGDCGDYMFKNLEWVKKKQKKNVDRS